MDRAARRAIPIAVFAVVAVTHFLGVITSYDSRWSIPIARSILHEGNTDLDEYADLLRANQFYAIERIDGHAYSSFPIGVSLVALPLVWAVDAAGIRIDNGKLEKLTASLVIALTAVLIYLIARRPLGVGGALLITFVFAFCTAAWSTGSRALWQHGPSMLVLTLALWLLILARERPWLVQFAGLPLTFACVIRPTNAIPLAVLSALVLVRHPRWFVPYALWMLPVAIPAALFTLSVHHAVLPAYYAPGKIGHGATFLPALAGTLVSPSRGLFVFSPVLVLSMYGAWLALRREPNLLDAAIASIVLLHWIALASFPIWWGGHSFGPRLFADMVPYLVYFLIPVVAAVRDRPPGPRAAWAAVVVVLVAVSFGINYRGANTRAVYHWNSEPVDVDDAPRRVWDWRDPQFLRELWPARPPSR